MKKINTILLHTIALGTIGCLHYYYNCKCVPKIRFESNNSNDN